MKKNPNEEKYKGSKETVVAILTDKNGKKTIIKL